jgi:formate hydrogenlyase subunit 4
MTIAITIAQLSFFLALAPILQGIIKTAKARLQGRQGPGIFQPWFDLLKYLSRESVVPAPASWIFRLAPFIAFAAIGTAVLLVPLFTLRSEGFQVGDAFTVVALLGLGRFALALAALDAGSNFTGMGTSREIAFAALIEPAVLLVVAVLAVQAPTSAVSSLTGVVPFGISWVLLFAAMAIVVIAETGRLPVDNPDTHLELTMVHEGMLLEYSGFALGLLLWASYLKQAVLLGLLVTWFLPFGLSADLSPASVAVSIAAFVLKLTVAGLLLAPIETSTAKLRILRVPGLLGGAAVLALLGLAARLVVGS